MEKWSKEVARDLLAFGSIIFYILVIGRALIGPYWPFVIQLVIAGIVLFLVYLFYKNADYYTARALILVVFTMLFYKELVYSLFASLVFVFVLVSSYYSGNKIKSVFFGVLLGIIGSLIGYYLPSILF